MKDFEGRLAVITGAGTGIGRGLALHLAREGCHVAICDLYTDAMEETRAEAERIMPAGVRVSAHECDVAEEAQILRFCEEVKAAHQTDQINLLFNNAGVSGGGSFIKDTREEWDRTFGILWSGVYYSTRAFMPLLLAADEGHIINISSVNGFWACLGPFTPHTAYSAAKFAVKGFSEALLVDLRMNAPHVKVSVVMPGHVGTNIAHNRFRMHGRNRPLDMSADEVAEAREDMLRKGMDVAGMDDDALRRHIHQLVNNFRDAAPVSPAQAADIILDGVRKEQWRIFVGEDAKAFDALVRQYPEEAYELSFVENLLQSGEFKVLKEE